MLRLVVVGVLAIAVALAYPRVRTGLLTVGLLAEVLELGARPLSMLFPAPHRVSTTYGTTAPDRMDIYHPSGVQADRSRAAVVLSLGVHPLPLDHPDVMRIAGGIARLGVVVGVPESTALRETRVTPEEPGRLAEAFLVVASLPEVDPDRIGLAGFSAGASIALIAAADPRIADRVSFLSSFGGYADAETLIVDVATRTVERHGTVTAWPAEPGIRRDVAALVVNALPPSAERDRLAGLLPPIVGSDQPPLGPDPDVLASLADVDVRAVYRIFSSRSRSEARVAIAEAGDALRLRLTAISPVAVASRIRAPVLLLHGEGDVAIPVSHAHLIADALPDGVLRRLTVFQVFQHGQPGNDGLGLGELPDMWQLYTYLHDLVAIATE